MSALDPYRARIDAELAGYLAARRWFRSKARTLASARVTASFAVPGAGDLCLVEATFAEGPKERYVTLLAFAEGDDAAAARAKRPHALVAEVPGGVVQDALSDPPALACVLQALGRNLVVEQGGARLRFDGFPALHEELASGRILAPRALSGEQTNSSMVFGSSLVFKVFRRLDAGVSPDLEVGRVLTDAGFAHAPPVAGAIELTEGGEATTVGILHRFVANQGDAWSWTLRAIESAIASPAAEGEIDAYRARAHLLGTRVAEMHRALAGATEPAFAPEPLDESTRRALYEAARRSLDAVRASLGERADALPADVAPDVRTLLAEAPALDRRMRAFAERGTEGMRMRIHGDLHLGQVLFTGSDFMIIDFEGEPARSMEERKAKRSPFADVAGILRSFDYAATTVGGGERFRAEAEAGFLEGYFATMGDSPVLPADPEARQSMLDFYLIEKCIYEVGYELGNRPDWVKIPVRGLLGLVKKGGA